MIARRRPRQRDSVAATLRKWYPRIAASTASAKASRWKIPARAMNFQNSQRPGSTTPSTQSERAKARTSSPRSPARGPFGR